jgi:uncharacterized protein (TIGR03086 family)
MNDGGHRLERTFAAAREPVTLLDDALLERPTPCADWTVGGLFGHVVGAIDMFANAAGASAPPHEGRSGSLLERFDAAVHRNLDAWHRVPSDDTAVSLPFGEFPASVARSINQLDTLVHGWDLAAAIGVPFGVDDELVDAALSIAQMSVPPSRGHVFDEERTPPSNRPIDRLIAFTGRDAAAWPGAIWLGGSLITLKAAGEAATGRPSIVEIWEREGPGPPAHVHDAHDELWYILEGRFTFQLGQHQRVAEAGDVVIGRRGVPHTFRADTSHARLLDIHTPSGFEQFFIQAGQPARELAPPAAVTGEPPAELPAAMKDFGAIVVGPPLRS